MAAGGLIDVVMNIVAADALSHEPGRLVRFHGLFNGGAVLGAAATGVALRFGASWRGAWIGIAVVAVVTAAVTRRSRIPEPPKSEHVSMLRALTLLRHEGLLVLALVFAASAMVEGGIATWGILYLRSHLGLGVLAGVSAYVVGESLATLTRIVGGPVVGGLGTRRAVMLGALLAAGGITLEALCGNAGIAAAGLAAAAVGISVVWPLLLADVNNQAEHPALAIGGVTACGYLGMVAGPPIVGVLSGLFGLRVGLLVLAGIALFVACTPAHVRTSSAGLTRGIVAVERHDDVAERALEQRRAGVEHFGETRRFRIRSRHPRCRRLRRPPRSVRVAAGGTGVMIGVVAEWRSGSTSTTISIAGSAPSSVAESGVGTATSVTSK